MGKKKKINHKGDVTSNYDFPTSKKVQFLISCIGLSNPPYNDIFPSNFAMCQSYLLSTPSWISRENYILGLGKIKWSTLGLRYTLNVAMKWKDSYYVQSQHQDKPKLLDGGGEIPKSQGRGWQFDSWLWNLLCTWQQLAMWSFASCALALACLPTISKIKQK